MTLIFGDRQNGLRICRGCGCDDNHACVTEDGPCAWVLLDFAIDAKSEISGDFWSPLGRFSVEPLPFGVCSACADRVGWDMRELATMNIGDLEFGEEEAA